MSQPPPTVAQGPYPTPEESTTSGWSVASLICGLLVCIPLITAFLAIIFGLVGLKQTSNPRVGGRGLAIAGVILGVVGLIGWAAGGFAIYSGYHAVMDAVQGPRAEASALFSDLADGDIVQARSRMSDDIPQQRVQQTSQDLQRLGQFQSISLRSVDVSDHNGQTQYNLGGVATFDNGSATFDVTIEPHPVTGWVIRDYRLTPQ
jgi:hypothetical protein